MNLEKIHLILFLKPYSNWTAFNTVPSIRRLIKITFVLNLVISGIPSIR